MNFLLCKNRNKTSMLTLHQGTLQKGHSIRNSFLKPQQNGKQNKNSTILKVKHRKYFSCQCSPDSTPLNVKKQFLKDRKQQLLVRNFKQKKVRIKEKTQCFNQTYIKQLRQTKQAMNWVKYNIEVGIYALVGRIKQNFISQTLQKKQYKIVKPELIRINKCIQQIQKFSKFIPAKYLSFGNPSNTFMDLKITEQEINRPFNNNQNQQKGANQKRSSLQMRPESKIGVTKLKDAIKGLSSALCLLSRKISLQKQNQLIKQFIDQNQSKIKDPNGKHRPSVEQIALLFQVLEINKRRCSILNELADRLQDVQNFKKSTHLTEEQLKKLQSMDLVKDLQSALQSNKDEEISKISQTVGSILANPSNFSIANNQGTRTKKILKTSNFSNDANKQEIKKSVRIKTRDHHTYRGRASIEFLIDQIQAVMAKTGSTVNVQKSKSRLTLNYPTTHQMKLQINTTQGKTHFFEEKSNTKKEVKFKQKKALAFANDLCEPEMTNLNKSESKSAKSIKSILSKKRSNKLIKERSGTEFPSSNSNKFVSIKTLKSMKSLRSMRSITSNGSYGSSKILARSLKTQRQIRILKGRLKKISGIRAYKTKIFKLNEQFSNAGCQNVDLLNFATQLQQQAQQTSSEEEFITSLNNLLCNDEQLLKKSNVASPKVIEQELNLVPIVYAQNNSRKATLIYPSPTNKKIQNNILNRNFQRKSKKAVGIKEHKDDTNNALREFLSLCSEIKSGHKIVEKKKIFYQHFQRLYQNKLIPQNLYQQYRKYFNEKQPRARVQSRVLKLTSQEQEHQLNKKNNVNMYQSLANLRRNISKNQRLSQINKFYYNFQQFKDEKQRIEQTKQLATKDQQFFYMKLYIDKKEMCIDPNAQKRDHFNSRYLTHDQKLVQKEF